MKLGINKNFEIIEVDEITDPSLEIIEYNEEDPEFPFQDKEFWTKDLLLKYCIEQIKKDGVIVEEKIYPKKETK